MTWYTGDPRHAPIFDEIEKQTDRGAALIATALLDRILMDAIQARMFLDEQASPNITGRLFKGSGSLAPLSNRIDACYLMQLYSENVFNLLHAIRGIRNDFAHDPNPISFEDSRIKQRCKHVHGLTLKAADFGVDFVIGLCQSFGQGERLREWSWSAGDHTTATAREIFINAIKLCVVLTVTATKAWANARPKARLPVRHVWPVPQPDPAAPAPSRRRKTPKQPP